MAVCAQQPRHDALVVVRNFNAVDRVLATALQLAHRPVMICLEDCQRLLRLLVQDKSCKRLHQRGRRLLIACRLDAFDAELVELSFDVGRVGGGV